MAEQFYTILTAIGKAKIANANVLGNKINLTALAVGDSNGKYYNPTESQAELVNEVWRGNIQNISIDKDNPNWIVTEGVIPSNVGGFTVREVGLFDEEGDLLVISKYPETYKPAVQNGSTKDLYIRMILEVSNTSSVTLKVDPTVILATKKDIQILSNDLTNLKQEVNTHLAESTTQAHLPKNVGLANVDNVKQMPISGGVFTGIVTAHSNTSYTVKQVRNIILSTANASSASMSDGDIWIKYS